MFLYLLITVLTLAYIYLWVKSRKAFKYWEERGVPFEKPRPLFGFWSKDVLMVRSVHDIFKELYEKNKGLKYFGYYEAFRPMLVLLDPDLIKQITVKDFDHFVDRRTMENDQISSEDLWWNENLLNLKGQEWKNVRAVVTPTFSSGKMKIIFGTISTCVGNCSRFMKACAKSGKPQEFKEIMGRYTLDVIANSAFGIDCNSFEDPDDTFPKMANKLVTFSRWKMFTFVLFLMFPFLTRFKSISLFDVETTIFFRSIVNNAIRQRNESENKKKDFLQLLINARKDESIGEDDCGESKITSKQILTDSSILAQSLLFFFAGFESVSTTISFAIYEIAVNPEIQERLHEEIEAVKERYNGEITYDAIQEMEYLDMAVTETTRRHPVLAALERKCTKDCQLYDSDLVIQKGNMVVIPAYGFHMDPDIYPEPEKFNPERFSKDEKAHRNPYVYQSFGIGPRNCVGVRFAQMEMKAVLAELITKFRFLPCEKTQIPVKYKPGFTFRAEKGIWLKVEERI